MRVLVIKHNGMSIEMGGKFPIRKRRYISISGVEKGTEHVIAYFTKDGEKLFDKFMNNEHPDLMEG